MGPLGCALLLRRDTPHFQIFEVASSGPGEPKILLEASQDQIPQDVSPDGQWLLYLQEMDTLGILPLARPARTAAVPPAGGPAQISAASRRTGGSSCSSPIESGRDEVYVRPVSDDARSLPVSRGGGVQPRWAANGDVFFWQRRPALRRPGAHRAGPPGRRTRALFRSDARASKAFFEGDYDVSADGQSIYLARTPDLLRPREIRVVLDWASEVPRLFAHGGGK